jgi:hypothetical protein
MAMNADELLAALEGRGFRVHLVDGGLRVDPFPKLTPDERAAIAEVARDKAARSTLERLLRERQSSAAENSGDPAKPATAATATAKLSLADSLLIREAQRKFTGSALVGLGRPGPRRRKDREQPNLTFEVTGRPVQPPEQPAAPEPEPLSNARVCSKCALPCYDSERVHCQHCDALLPDEVVETFTRDETALQRSDTSTDEATPVSAESVANEKIPLEPEPEAPVTNDSDETSPPTTTDNVDVANPSSPEPASAAEMSPDRSKRILLWVTVRRVQDGDERGIELELEPSPETDTDGIRFFIEGGDPSVLSHFQSGTPWLVNAWLNHEGYLLFHQTIGLRLGIEIER